MTPTSQVAANGIVYTVADDFTSVYRVLIAGTASDETFGPWDAPGFTLQSLRPDLNVKTTAKGDWAVIGHPEQAFPNLNTTSYTIGLVFSAPGFMDVAVSVTIPALSSFPVSGPAVTLRREPVRVQGRVVADTPQRPPVAGASVIGTVDPSAPTVHPIALRTPLRASHAVGTTVREISLTTSGSTTLVTDANSASITINLASRAGLAPGSILRLFNSLETAVEYGIVDTLGPGGAGAGLVNLRQPLYRSFPAGGTVRFMATGASATAGVLLRDADPETGLILASAALAASPIEIDPGATAVEYHELGALTDANGYYALDGIGSLQNVFFEAAHSGFTTVTQSWAVEYDRPVNVVNFRLP